MSSIATEEIRTIETRHNIGYTNWSVLKIIQDYWIHFENAASAQHDATLSNLLKNFIQISFYLFFLSFFLLTLILKYNFSIVKKKKKINWKVDAILNECARQNEMKGQVEMNETDWYILMFIFLLRTYRFSSDDVHNKLWVKECWFYPRPFILFACIQSGLLIINSPLNPMLPERECVYVCVCFVCVWVYRMQINGHKRSEKKNEERKKLNKYVQGTKIMTQSSHG